MRKVVKYNFQIIFLYLKYILCYSICNRYTDLVGRVSRVDRVGLVRSVTTGVVAVVITTLVGVVTFTGDYSNVFS